MTEAEPEYGAAGRKRLKRRSILIALAFVPALAVAASFIRPGPAASPVPVPAHFADASDIAAVADGKRLYRERCASCHGRYLQGQPLWQLSDAYSGRRAPAHDQTGHTWKHSDEELFQMTKYGRFDDGPAASMPAFGGVLSDRDILDVIAFIKARWPVGLRVLQAMRNPGRAGMPAGAEQADWTLPPDCGNGAPRNGRPLKSRE